jgi:hypothetical protein
MRVLGFVALACLGVTAAAVAKDPAPDKIVCKRQYDADTGSHFQSSRRVCRTQAEWKEIENQTEQTMRKIRDGGSANPSALSQGLGSPR